MTAHLSQDIEHRIAWLREEIDRCLLCDLPFGHLERELVLIIALENSRKRRMALNPDTERSIIR